MSTRWIALFAASAVALLPAIAAGADYLVVGRPVVESADPRAAAEAIHAEIAQSLV